MSKSELLAGLDIGSSQVCCVLGRRAEDSDVLEIVAGSRVPSRGVKGGVVINLHETANAVQQVVDQLAAFARVGVVEELPGLVGGGQRADHIEEGAAHEDRIGAGPSRFEARLFQPGEDEFVKAALGGRDSILLVR